MITDVLRKSVDLFALIRQCFFSFSLICCIISKRSCLHIDQWKAFDVLNKMWYILWVVTLLEACDVTNNGSHLGRHLGFNQELEVRLKPQETARNGTFLFLT